MSLWVDHDRKAVVAKIDKICLPGFYEMFAPLVAKAIPAASNVTLDGLLLDWMRGVQQPWAVSRFEPFKPLAVFFTEIIESDGARLICAHTTAGSEVWRWAALAQKAVEAEARAANCRFVCFFGRRAWLRIHKGYRIVQEAPKPGEVMFWKDLGDRYEREHGGQQQQAEDGFHHGFEEGSLGSSRTDSYGADRPD